MNLSEQKLIGIDEIHLSDSMNASLLELRIKRIENTIVPNTNALIIYVDKSNKGSELADKKTYVFSLNKKLEYLNQVSDEFISELKVKNNDIFVETFIKRMIGVNSKGKYLLEEPVIEVLESIPLTLFEGENYIYTNYDSASIELIYPKDNELNRNYLNSNIYYNYKINNPSNFSLDDIYFKDAFTKTEDKLNLEVDNLNIGCITSKNNKFSLDSEGNLVVNSISTVMDSSNQNIFNLIYPVGSIYLSVNDINPATLFGGAWEQIKDKFLLGSGDTYSINSTGGEKEHILTKEEIPSHGHIQKGITGDGHHNAIVDNYSGTLGGATQPQLYVWSNTRKAYLYTFNTGNDKAHNNMPPYLVVSMWKRIA